MRWAAAADRVPPEPIEIRVRQRFPHARDAAYAWLTDIQDDDPQRTGAVLSSRRVVERRKDGLAYEGETEVLGRRVFARTEVTLLPPGRWEARITKGIRTGSTTDYRLEPNGAGCQLIVTYRFVFADARTRIIVRLLRPLVRRALVRMWAGFADDMARELPRAS